MDTATKETKIDYFEIVHSLVQEFAKTAVGRDKKGGTAKAERDLLRKSGLLTLIIPKSLGGHGENWNTVFQITRMLANVDGSLAHLFAYHFLCLTSVHLYGSKQQREKLYRETAENDLFWGNAFNPRDENLVVTKEGTQWKLNGKKTFCSGAKDSDRLLISAKSQELDSQLLLLFRLKGQE